MAFLQAKDGYITVGGVAFNCQTNSEVELDRETERIICHENAPGGSLALGEITGTMTVTGIMGDSDTLNGINAADYLIDGTEVTALFRAGPAGEGGIQFTAYVTNVKLTSDQTGKTISWTATLSNTNTPETVTLT